VSAEPTTGGVQLPLNGLPLNPHELAKLPILARGKLYAELALHPTEREAAEEAVRAVQRRMYRRAGL
jgi:hypothetical protein